MVTPWDIDRLSEAFIDLIIHRVGLVIGDRKVTGFWKGREGKEHYKTVMLVDYDWDVLEAAINLVRKIREIKEEG